MKKSIQIIATALVMLFGESAFGQTDSMYVHNGTTTVAFAINQVDSVTFYRSTQTEITDEDGNVYTSVKIGTQDWMVENLRTTKYSDGTAIPNLTGNTEWGNLSTGAWCHYNNDSSQYEATYGKLYNWYAVETGKLCPIGWHVPTDAEWTVLTNHLTADGHSGVEGTALKATLGWSWVDYNNKSGNGTDNYGWLGLSGGGRGNDGYFSSIGGFGVWWCSSEDGTDDAWYRHLGYYDVDVIRDDEGKGSGFSVRCLKD